MRYSLFSPVLWLAVLLILPLSVFSQIPVSAQPLTSAPKERWWMGVHIQPKLSINSVKTPLSAPVAVINRLPDIGIHAAYQPQADNVLQIVAEASYATYSAQNVGSDPFGAMPSTFRMTAHLDYGVLAAHLRLYDIASIGFAYLLPLGGTYRSATEVFGTGEEFTAEQDFTLPANRLNTAVDVRLSVNILTIPIGFGALRFTAFGGYCLSHLIYPAPFNTAQLGSLIQRGLRTLNVQPVSLSIGVQYYWEL